MKLILTESYLGEFDQKPDLLKERAINAASKAVSSLLQKSFSASCSHDVLQKASSDARGGQVDALDRITDRVTELYARRIERMKIDLVEAVKTR